MILIHKFISYFTKKVINSLTKVRSHCGLCIHMNAVKSLQYLSDILNVFWKLGLPLQVESLKGIQARDILGISKLININWVSGYCILGNS